MHAQRARIGLGLASSLPTCTSPPHHRPSPHPTQPSAPASPVPANQRPRMRAKRASGGAKGRRFDGGSGTEFGCGAKGWTGWPTAGCCRTLSSVSGCGWEGGVGERTALPVCGGDGGSYGTRTSRENRAGLTDSSPPTATTDGGLVGWFLGHFPISHSSST